MQVTCPACSSESEYENNPYRPFCSAACKNQDFLSWADEGYRIPGRQVVVTGDDDEN